MTFERIAGLCFCLVLTAEAASGQSRSESVAPGQATPTSTVIERVHPTGAPAPWRRVQSRTASGNRQVVVDTLEVPDIEGRLAPSQEIVTETDRSDPNTEQTRRDVFQVGANGRRTLSETTQSVRETLSGGNTRATRDTSVSDVNGQVRLTARQMEEARSAGANARELQSTLLLPGLNEPFRASTRTDDVERVVGAGQNRRESTALVLDVNGRWQPVEVLRGEAREMGNERLEEQAIERLDINGKLVVDERSVSRHSSANGLEQTVIETHVPYEAGSRNFVVDQRIHRTTTTNADGGRSTVEEVESRSPGNPSDPTRLTSRTVTTVRRIGPDRLVTDRQVFERDVNGRMRLIVSETEDSVGR
jgi:hypothetical protein